MKIIWSLYIKNWRGFWNDTVAVVMSFIIPAVLIFILGNVFGIGESNKSSGSRFKGIRVGIVNDSDEAMVQALIDTVGDDETFTLETTNGEAGSEVLLTREALHAMIENNEIRYGLVFSEDSIGDSFGFKVDYLVNPRNQIEGQMVEGYLQKNLAQGFFSNITQHPFLKVSPELGSEFNDRLASIIAEAFGQDESAIRKTLNDDSMIPDFSKMTGASEEGEGGLDIMSDFMDLSKEEITGAKIKDPNGIQVVGGYAVMFMLFALSGAATVLFEEKQAGIYLRILSSPATRSHILWSKFMFGTSLGFLQMMVLFLAGNMLFGVEIFHALGNLMIVSLFVSGACNAFGMLLASVSKTQAQASGLATFLVLMMSALGGAWFPISFFSSELLQSFSKLTIVYWSMEALFSVLIDGKSIFQTWQELTVLLGISVGVTMISLWRFRKGDIF